MSSVYIVGEISSLNRGGIMQRKELLIIIKTIPNNPINCERIKVNNIIGDNMYN
jgi:hypothetical protein